MNVATERLHVVWDTRLSRPSDLLGALREIGYAAYPCGPQQHLEQLQRAARLAFRRLFIAGLCMMQVMMYAAPAYFGDGTLEPDMASLMRWASLLLTVPAIVYSAQPFFTRAWSDIRRRSPGMDVPVALGIGAAFLASVAATWRGQGEVYFDSVTMFIFLLLGSRYFELVARRKAAKGMEKLQHALPASAARLRDFPNGREVETVAAAQLAEGDWILVKPGEAFAADGVIVEGVTEVNLALLTGESRPVPKSPGDSVPGGAINASQAIVLQVSKLARDSLLSTLVRLVEVAGQGKPRLAQWADQVAARFVTALLLFTLATFLFWQWWDAARAWPIAIAVLVVSCPCALSLATPTVLAAATARLTRQGVLVVRAHVLETLARTTHVIFDKTGTLTEGKPTLRHIVALGAEHSSWCLQIAAALEGASAHPLAAAIVAATGEHATPALQARDTHAEAGQGAEGRVAGTLYRLGSAAWVSGLTGVALPGTPPDGMTPVYLGTSGRWLARFDLADSLRADAQATIAAFQSAGKTVMLLSGDDAALSRRVGAELGIDVVHGGCGPQQKLALVQALQRDGAVVAMIGDGVNDAAVLRAADVSFAMGAGAALALASADTVLISNRLSSVADTAATATRALRIIRQNLAWAAIYNAIAIPAAAFGFVSPWWSGIGMAVSSAVVVANALRMYRGMQTEH
jgi:Cu2+-exporting ATPase